MKKSYLKLTFLPILMTTTIVATGCSTVSEEDLKKPIQQYLSKEYNIKEDFDFLTWDDNAFEGIDHQTSIELKKPYHTTAYLTLERDTYKIVDYSDDVYEELFKGAYIEQHPEVTVELESIINSFNLVDTSPDEYDVAKGNFYYYLKTNIDSEQKKELVKQFKVDQSINTEKLLPSLKPDINSNGLWNESGVINFDFYFNTVKSEFVPNAQDVLEEIKKVNVLSEGIYCIEIFAITSTDSETTIGADSRNNGVQFRVDSIGEIKDIKVLSYDY